MLARDAADKLGWKKPIALHTPLIPGLKGGSRMNPEGVKELQTKEVEVCKVEDAGKAGIEERASVMIEMKMSKSDPTSSINIHDTPDDVRKKIKKAYCPPEKEKENENPMLMMARYIVFPRLGRFDVKRPEKYGGDISFADYDALTSAYFGGNLSPVDLKTGVADSLIGILAPVAEYFSAHPENYERMKAILASVKKLR
ncbi:hypothetical protein [Candidatus Methanomethylophilus sp. 1R26]|uniref:hypothetical protein n=1 Tax=Candidatus Methanomethylophilus sp. 1R26 TaxID=1769296 RepID=UPI001F2328A1|nr:hypothetical protein [Candidatus Methanomethylophilus sp. 1R26]